MALRTIDSLGKLSGKRVIVRCDLNVPLKNGVIGDDGRIRASVPTLRALLGAGAKVIVISHLGRPEGAPDEQYSLQPVARRLSELLGQEVEFASDTVGDSAAHSTAGLRNGCIALLENLRFNPGETSKSDDERSDFAARLAAFGDALVSDGFGVVHRKQASVFELAELLPSAAGTLIVDELDVLEKLTTSPARPYTVVLGGSKVSDKLGVIEHLLPKVDSILIGGGMMFTFLAARGFRVGASLLEEDQIDTVRGYLEEAERTGVELVLPTDVVVASSFSADADHEVRPVQSIEETSLGGDGIGLDIGPETAAHSPRSSPNLPRSSGTARWACSSSRRSQREPEAVAQGLTEVDGLSVVGGGDSAAAVRDLGFSDEQFGHISTGGGASLEFLEGKRLPGLEVLGWQA